MLFPSDRQGEPALGLGPNPLNTEMHLLASADRLCQAGQPDKAVNLLAQSMANGTASREVLIGLSLLYLQQGVFDPAERILEVLSQCFPDDPWAHNLLGNVRYAQGRFHAAQEALEKACTLTQRMAAVIHANLAAVHLARQDRSQAETHLNRATSLDPQNEILQQQYRQFHGVSGSSDSTQGRFQRASRSAARCADQQRKRRQIIFVTERPRGREAKLAYGLRSAGWPVKLFYRQAANFDLTPFFDETHVFQNDAEALHLAAEHIGSIFHVFSLMVDSAAIAYVQHKPGKVIFDPNDVFEGTINQCQDSYQQQRYCIENADGICCRDLQVRHVRKALNYRVPERVIFFPEYCWDVPEAAGIKKEIATDGELRIVSIGNFGIEKQGEGEWGYLDIARRLARQQIHFHVYLHWFWANATHERKRAEFADYLELAATSPYFHLHPTVAMDQLIGELQQYDLGINVISAKLNGTPLKKYHDAHFANCLSLRNIDYMDAGLPVIITPELRLQRLILRRYAVAIDAHPELFENAGGRLRAFKTPAVRQQIRKSRSAYSITRQIGRLIDFYNSF